jgi:hypothetical protein
MLLLGDSHIPRRAKEIPQPILDEITRLANKELFDYTFFTGDLISYEEFIDFLDSKTKKPLFRVMGNMDYYAGKRDYPIYQELEIPIIERDQEKLRIGMTHGSEIKNRGDHSELEDLAREKGYNILISGHTHQEEVVLRKTGILLLNPGSITGAWSFIASGIPSFIQLFLNSESRDIKVILNQLKQEDHQITKTKSYFMVENNQIKQKY